MLDNIRLVLIETSHPGNIGAAARAMHTMGLSQLALVNPQQFPCAEATARASGADSVLMRAKVCTSLDEALSDCRLVLGASARDRSLPWPALEARAAASKLLEQAQGGTVALLFGRENSGLSNEELDRCHALVRIPSNPNYSSLNLAAAVQVLSYEIRCAWLAGQAPSAPVRQASMSSPPASGETMQHFYAHLEQALQDIGFFNPAKPKRTLRRLYRLFNRACLEESEVQLLRGILTEAQKKAAK